MTEKIEKIAELIAQAAGDKKARDIAILDMTNISPVTDFFVVASAGTVIQAQAVADNIEDVLAEAGVELLRKEGFRDSRWILLDYGDAVAHIFVQEDREFYNLERLWGDAKVRHFEVK
ncbi:MAG: ribosome silencing factor [Sporomusaceae bacterium]|nr:ribosome silencing factor [Sporomusaceae bacterium]